MNNADSELSPKTTVTWTDLLLYLLAGFGGFLLLSLGVARLFPDLSGPAVFLLYLVNVLAFSGATYLLGIRRGKITWAQLGIRPFRWQWQWLLLGVGVAVLLLPGRALLGLLVQLLLAGNLDSVQARGDLIMGGGFTPAEFGLTLLGVGILVPIAEELYFRGLLHSWFMQKVSRFWLRILLSGAIFALGHADSVGVVAASFVIGVVNPIFYERTRSLAVPIIIHVTTNSTAVLLLYAGMALLEYFPDLA